MGLSGTHAGLRILSGSSGAVGLRMSIGMIHNAPDTWSFEKRPTNDGLWTSALDALRIDV
jgi:hypothetical protein